MNRNLIKLMLFLSLFCLSASDAFTADPAPIPPDTKIVLQITHYSSSGSTQGYWAIYPDGKIEFGELADHIEHVESDHVLKLIQMFRDIDFFALEEKNLKCDEYYTPHDPMVYIKLAMDGKTKEIAYQDQSTCKNPNYLKVSELTHKMNELIESTPWVHELRRDALIKSIK